MKSNAAETPVWLPLRTKPLREFRFSDGGEVCGWNGAKEVMRVQRPDGGIGHAEIQLGDSRIMLADEDPKMEAYGPYHYGGSPITLHVYLQDVDAATKQATGAGCKVVRPLADQFYGDRTAGLQDPFGHRWFFATHVRDVSVDEMKQHMKTLAAA